MDLDFYPKDLYKKQNSESRFEFLANVYRRKNPAYLKHYIIKMNMIYGRYPYVKKILETFEYVFQGHYPFLIKASNGKKKRK